MPTTLSDLRRALSLPLLGDQAHAAMRPQGRIAHPAQDAPPPNLAGVLMLTYPSADTLNFVLIQRAERLYRHGGQVALPGGRREASDSTLVATAVREAEEELGISLDQAEILGSLSPVYVQPSHFMVYPAVAYLDKRPRFAPNPDEVAAVIEVPLDALHPAYHVEADIVTAQGVLLRAPAYAFGGCLVWGATAMILHELELLLRSSA
ncbi:MAG: CoA pyrophosphatase [Anaerolineae bacterium]|nr:CoA pyrophosphatase [Anaerolineae bacterium]